jgi:hypothetical protein
MNPIPKTSAKQTRRSDTCSLFRDKAKGTKVPFVLPDIRILKPRQIYAVLVSRQQFEKMPIQQAFEGDKYISNNGIEYNQLNLFAD